MKNLEDYIKEVEKINEKKTTGAGCVEMVKSVIDELLQKPDYKGKDKELLTSAGQFMYDYLKELTPADYEKLVKELELPDLRSQKDLTASDVQAAISLKIGG